LPLQSDGLDPPDETCEQSSQLDSLPVTESDSTGNNGNDDDKHMTVFIGS